MSDEIKFVIDLDFQNAGIFKKSWKENGQSRDKDDRILSVKSRNQRTKDEYIDSSVDTFYYHFIANCIRVLSGKRPVPLFRPSCNVQDDISVELAKRSFVKIDSMINTTKNGDRVFVFETQTTRKCLDNSWSDVHPSWLRIKKLVPEYLFEYLVEVADELCKCDSRRMLFSDVANILKESGDEGVEEIAKAAKEEVCSPLMHLMTGGVHSLQQAGYRGLGIFLKSLVTKGVGNVARLDGSIRIPVTEDELFIFQNGTGCATLLEGGVVTISKIISLEHSTLNRLTGNYFPVACER
jgi:hypothetical protein